MGERGGMEGNGWSREGMTEENEEKREKRIEGEQWIKGQK